MTIKVVEVLKEKNPISYVIFFTPDKSAAAHDARASLQREHPTWRASEPKDTEVSGYPCLMMSVSITN